MKMTTRFRLLWGLALVPAVVASPAMADTLWDNGPLVTHPGDGFGGFDASRVLNVLFDDSALGWGLQQTSGHAIADDFTIKDAAGWHIDSITFFAYQTNGPQNGSISINADILSDFPVGLPAGTFTGGPGVFAGIYRDSEMDVGNSSRAINAITVVVNADFAAGSYWIAWDAIGSPNFSGPFAPPVSYPDAVDGLNPLGQAPNAQTVAGGEWIPVVDGISLTPDEFPFMIEGTLIEPPCPWDCGDNDGTVGIVDFLALLAQWGGPGACDLDGGGVGITDFLELLANWGACP